MRSHKFGALFAGTVFIVITACGPTAAPTFSRDHTETLLFQVDLSELVVVEVVTSPDGRHVGFSARDLAAAGKSVAVIDGEIGEHYDLVLLPQFSPDSQRYAYLASSVGMQLVVVDGREGKPYDRVLMGNASDPQFAVFSPDSRRIKYKASVGDKWVYVIDQKESNAYDGVDFLQFSPNSQRVAFVAWEDDDQFIVLDDNEGEAYDFVFPLGFSPDSQHFAYLAATRELNTQFIILDGTKLERYTQVGYFVFSPNSRRFAYGAKIAESQKIIVDGEEIDVPYDEVRWLQFSPDSSYLVFIAHEGEQQMAVIDEEPEAKYSHVEHITISPDSERIAYLAEKEEQGERIWSVVVDGVSGRWHDADSLPLGFDASLTFSPDSQHFAYRVLSEKGTYVVADGMESARYEAIDGLAFTPDSRHVVYAATDGDEAFVVVDDTQGPIYDGILVPESGIVFDDLGQFHYLALRSANETLLEIILVEESVE